MSSSHTGSGVTAKSQQIPSFGRLFSGSTRWLRLRAEGWGLGPAQRSSVRVALASTPLISCWLPLYQGSDLTKVPKRRFMHPLVSSLCFQIYVERNKPPVVSKSWTHWPIKQLVSTPKDSSPSLFLKKCSFIFTCKTYKSPVRSWKPFEAGCWWFSGQRTWRFLGLSPGSFPTKH